MPNNLLPGILITIVFVVFMIIKQAKSSLKTDIERDAKTFFNAKEDLRGNLLLEFQSYSILLEYDLANNTRGYPNILLLMSSYLNLTTTKLKLVKSLLIFRNPMANCMP